MKQSPIFSRSYDLLHWLVPATIKFPREQRFVMANKVQHCAFEFQDHIIEAAHALRPEHKLRHADSALSKLRVYLRLCVDLRLLTTNQYAHVGKIIDEIGRLLGGWLKSLDKSR